MREKTITLYQFNELPTEAAKEKAREWMRQCEAEDFQPEMEPVETAAKLLGIDFDTDTRKSRDGKLTWEESRIFWSVGYCPGRGASFAATYRHVVSPTNIGQRVRAEFPKDKALHGIASGLAAIQRKYGYVVVAHVKTNGRDSHKYSMYMDSFELDNGSQREIKGEDEDALLKVFRDFADWIFDFLQAEYEYRQSDEAVDEAMEANRYEFDEDGERAA